MSKASDRDSIDRYRFHHVDIHKCLKCKDFACEDACFRGIYKVINKDTKPKCLVIEDREDFCLKCHICTTACKSRAITID